MTKTDNKSQFGKHTNDEQHTNNNITNNCTLLKVQPDTQKRKCFDELEMTKQKKHPNNLVNNTTNFRSQKLFQLIT